MADGEVARGSSRLSSSRLSITRFLMVAWYFMSLILFGVVARFPLGGTATTIFTLMVMAFVGIVFLRQLVPAINSSICLLVFGSVFGLVCGRLSLILAGLGLGPSVFSAALAFGLLPCIAFLLLRLRPRPLPRWGAEDQHELNWILGLNSAVLLAMAFPFWGAGHLTSKGYAFVPHFDEDYFNHIAYTAELARSLPPQNPYFAGQTLHYYWFYHLWPAAVVNLSGATARDALVLTLPSAVLLFVGALTCLVRFYMPKSSPRHLAIGLGFFAFSYIGIFYIVRLNFVYLNNYIGRFININYSYLSHSWFRDCLYEPHAVTAITFLLFLFYLRNITTTRSALGSSLLSGLVLGIIIMTDLFIGMIGLIWFVTANVRPFLRGNEGRAHIVLSSLVSIVVILSAFGLQLFPARGGALRLGIHPMAKFAPIYLLVELGPLFAFGAVGLYLSLRQGRIPFFHSMLLLLAIALFLCFTVVIPLEPNQVIRKAIKVVQVPLVVFTSVACSVYLDLPSRHWFRLAGVPVILAGFLTLCTDIFQYVDIETERSPATTYISLSKMQALEWIRNHTASDAIVQLLDEVRPERGYAGTLDLSIPALGERRTLFGNYKLPYLLHVDKAELNKRKVIIEQVFVSGDPYDLRKNLERLPLHYLLVDASFSGPLDAIRQLKVSGYLEEVFRAGEITVLVKKSEKID
jgi:hypothetical protein